MTKRKYTKKTTVELIPNEKIDKTLKKISEGTCHPEHFDAKLAYQRVEEHYRIQLEDWLKMQGKACSSSMMKNLIRIQMTKMLMQHTKDRIDFGKDMFMSSVIKQK